MKPKDELDILNAIDARKTLLGGDTEKTYYVNKDRINKELMSTRGSYIANRLLIEYMKQCEYLEPALDEDGEPLKFGIKVFFEVDLDKMAQYKDKLEKILGQD